LKVYLSQNELKIFTNKQVRQALRENPSQQKKYMVELQQYGYIKKKQGNKKAGFIYEVANYSEYNQLQTLINTTLDNILQRIEVVSSSQEVLRHGEPLKSATAKQRRQVVQ
jgi:predicted transcriptional regulator